MCVCLVFNKSADKDIVKQYFCQGMLNNPDGYGVGYFSNGKIVIDKKGTYGVLKNDDFENAYRMIDDAFNNADGYILLHARIGTGSQCDNKNAHPFYINDDKILIHNGILNGIDSRSDKSDTLQLVELLEKKQLNVKEFNEVVGYYNRIAILNKDNQLYMTNKNDWIYVYGIYLSNNSCFNYYYEDYEKDYEEYIQRQLDYLYKSFKDFDYDRF